MDTAHGPHPLVIRLTALPNVKTDLYGSFLVFTAKVPGRPDPWPVRCTCWAPIDAERQCFAWLTALDEAAPLPEKGVEFELYWGVEQIANAHICGMPEDLERELPGYSEMVSKETR